MRNGPQAITNGLILALDAMDRLSYPGSGTLWRDISGNNRNGTKAGTQSPTYPQYSDAGYFNFSGGVLGTNYSRFDITNIPSFSQLSVFAWYRSTNTTDPMTILRMDNSDFELSIKQSGSTSLWFAAGTNYNDVNISLVQASAVNGNWHQMGLTFDGQTLLGYFDSSRVGTITRGSSTTTAAGTLRIGARDDFYWEHFFGDIAQVMLYNRVLTPTEIQQNFNLFKSRFNA